MHARSALLNPDTTRHAAAFAVADAPADPDDDYSWLGYESAHPLPDAFVLPADVGRGERDVD